MMWLLRIIPICLLIGPLHGAIPAQDLPKLPNNKLLTGIEYDREYKQRHRTIIDCREGERRKTEFERSGYSYNPNPSQVLTEYNFRHYPFTSKGIQPGAFVGADFSFVKMVHGSVRVVYVLQPGVDGERAYWLPQGKSLDIPKHPGPGDPKFVFTADFSGCYWLVTPMNNGKLRLRHVERSDEGSKENAQFNNQEKGGPVTYFMRYEDYGYIQDTKNRDSFIDILRAYAYMHYDNGWKLYVQQQTCAPEVGQVTVFDKDGRIDKMKMNYYDQHRYNDITNVKAFRIPV